MSHHYSIPISIADKDLTLIIKNDKGRLCYSYALMESETGVPAGNLKVYLTSKRKIPKDVRNKLISFHNVQMPNLIPLNVKSSWLYFLEPVAEVNCHHTFADARQVLTREKAKVLIIRRTIAEEVCAIVLKEKFEEELRKAQPNEDKMTLFSLADKYKGKYEVIEWYKCRSVVPVAIRENRSNGYALMNEKVNGRDRITRVLLTIPRLPRIANTKLAVEYSRHQFPREIASHLFELIREFIQENTRILDVATGPGTFAVTAALLARKGIFDGEDCIDIIAAENEGEKEFTRILKDRIKGSNLDRVESAAVSNGREEIRWFGMQNIIVWNLVLPPVKALRGIPKILKKNGVVAISRYDLTTLNELYGLVLDAMKEYALKRTAFPKRELHDLCKLADYIHDNIPERDHKNGKIDFEILVKHFQFFPVEFSDSEAFLRFIQAAFPFVVRCFAAFKEYPTVLDGIKICIKRTAEKRYGSSESSDIRLRFGVNFVVGQYNDPQDLSLNP